MTVTATNSSSGPFAPDGFTTIFPFTFAALSVAEIMVVRRSGVGVDAPLTGYTITLSGTSGGSITFSTAPLPGDPIYILSNPDFTQQATFSGQGSWSPTSLDGALDRAAIRDIALQGQIGTLRDDYASLLAQLTDSGVIEQAYPFVDVLIVAGQSNAAGRASGSYGAYAPTSKVKIWNGSAFVTYVPGSMSGLQLPSTVYASWGAEAEFARLYSINFPNRQLCIIKGHVDSTSLAVDWNPASGTQYGQMTSVVAAAMASIRAQGLTPNVLGAFWMQGEQDATDSTNASNYQANLTSLISHIRSAWSLPSPAPIVIGRIARNPNEWTYAATVAAAQKAVADADLTLALINTDDIPLDFSDNAHYGNIGQKRLGGRLYACILSTGAYGFHEFPSGGDHMAAENGDFSSGDLSAWLTFATGTIAQNGDGTATFAGTAGDLYYCWPSGFVPGQVYTVKVGSFSPQDNAFIVEIDNGATQLTFANLGTTQPLTFTFTAQYTSQRLQFHRTTGSSTVFDDISIT